MEKYMKLAKLVETNNGSLGVNSGVAITGDVDTHRGKDMDNQQTPRENGDLSKNKMPMGEVPEHKIEGSLPASGNGIPTTEVKGKLPAKKAEAEEETINMELVKIAAALGNVEAMELVKTARPAEGAGFTKKPDAQMRGGYEPEGADFSVSQPNAPIRGGHEPIGPGFNSPIPGGYEPEGAGFQVAPVQTLNGAGSYRGGETPLAQPEFVQSLNGVNSHRGGETPLAGPTFAEPIRGGHSDEGAGGYYTGGQSRGGHSDEGAGGYNPDAPVLTTAEEESVIGEGGDPVKQLGILGKLKASLSGMGDKLEAANEAAPWAAPAAGVAAGLGAAGYGAHKYMQGRQQQPKTASEEAPKVHPYTEAMDGVFKLAKAGVPEAYDFLVKMENLMPGLADEILK